MRRFVTHYAAWRGFGYGTPFEPSTLCSRDTLMVDVTRYEYEVTCTFCLSKLRKQKEAAACGNCGEPIAKHDGGRC